MSVKGIVIVDYGIGNLGSIANMLKYLGVPSTISSEISEIEAAEKLILPGVGSFDNGMKNINEMDLARVLGKRVLEDRVPILGICLGMQLLAKKSEEGKLSGLGWIDAEVRRFDIKDPNKNHKVPHMGWNLARPCKESSLFTDMPDDPRFYFVHSYHLVCAEQCDVLCQTSHGYDFASALERENIYGVQFHPEKSHMFGMRLFENFAKI